MAKPGISLRQYLDLADAFKRTHNVEKAAVAIGIGPHTARKYINEGSSRFPAIRARLQASEDVEVVGYYRRDAEQHAKELEVYHGIATRLTAQVGQVAQNIVLVPDGKKRADGKIEVNQATIGSLSSTLKRNLDISLQTLDAADDERNKPSNQQNVQVNVSYSAEHDEKLSPQELAEAGWAFLAKHEVLRDTSTREAHEKAIETVYEAARRAKAAESSGPFDDSGYDNDEDDE